MSVVVNMPMPNRCVDCGVKLVCKKYNAWIDIMFAPMPTPLCSGCIILCSLPENHGRLVDCNEVIEVQLYDAEHEEWYEEKMTLDDFIGYASSDVKTIVPAERSENETV